jgi:uncharacterized protein YoxC
MTEKLNISLLVVSVLLFVLVVLQFVVIGSYSDSFKEHQQMLDVLHNKCDSIIDKNLELYDKVYELQDSIITLKYKED